MRWCTDEMAPLFRLISPLYFNVFIISIPKMKRKKATETRGASSQFCSVKKTEQINTFCTGALERGVVCSRFILGSIFATSRTLKHCIASYRIAFFRIQSNLIKQMQSKRIKLNQIKLIKIIKVSTCDNALMNWCLYSNWYHHCISMFSSFLSMRRSIKEHWSKRSIESILFCKKAEQINTFFTGALERGVVCSRFILGSVFATTKALQQYSEVNFDFYFKWFILCSDEALQFSILDRIMWIWRTQYFASGLLTHPKSAMIRLPSAIW